MGRDAEMTDRARCRRRCVGPQIAHRIALCAGQSGRSGRGDRALPRQFGDGDGPERGRLEALAGPGVEFAGRVSEAEKHRLLCAAWMLLHPAMIEGWGIVVTEAAARGTPALGFRVAGLRDSVLDGRTGRLVGSEIEFAAAWAALTVDHQGREALGRAARRRARQLHWSAAVDGFCAVADEAIALAGQSRAAGGARAC